MYDKQFIFLIGAPRSGTTWLGRMMGQHPRVSTREPETTIFCGYVSRLRAQWDKEVLRKLGGARDRGLPLLLEEADFDAVIQQFLENLYLRLLSGHPESTHYLERAPDNAFAVELINTYLPDARFVHIIRDGRDVAVSMLTRKRRNEQWDLRVQSVVEAARMWRRAVRAARKASGHEGRYLEVRYERMVSHCQEELQRIFAFCGLDADERLVQEIADANHFSKQAVSVPNPDVVRDNGKAPWEQLMAPCDRYAFHRAAGDLLQELGYAERSWWYRNGIEKALVRMRWRLGRLGTRPRRSARHGGVAERPCRPGIPRTRPEPTASADGAGLPPSH